MIRSIATTPDAAACVPPVAGRDRIAGFGNPPGPPCSSTRGGGTKSSEPHPADVAATITTASHARGLKYRSHRGMKVSSSTTLRVADEYEGFDSIIPPGGAVGDVQPATARS